RSTRPHPTDAEVRAVGDVDCIVGTDCDRGQSAEAGLRGRAPVAAEAALAVAGDGADDAIRRDPPHANVVGDVQAAVLAHGDAARSNQPGAHGQPSIAAEAAYANACHGIDDAIRADAAHPEVALVDDVQAAIGGCRQAQNRAELRQPRRAAVAAEARCTRAG